MSTITEPDNAESNAMTVDVQIKEVVLAAALARLPFVQQQERKDHGKTWTNLSTLAVDILTGWQPGVTTRTPQPKKTVCPHCGKEVYTYNTGKLRVHGKPGERCPETFVQDAKGAPDTRPLRFPMNRAQYEAVKERIHFHGQSVASVLSQRLAHFAMHGKL